MRILAPIVGAVFSGAILGNSHSDQASAEDAMSHVVPDYDHRTVVDTSAGSPYETVGALINSSNKDRCSGFYMMGSVGISGAHCYQELIDGGPIPHIMGIRCRINDGITDCTLGAHIVEVAIPERYTFSKEHTTVMKNMGYDIAFVRINSAQASFFPDSQFSLSAKVNTGDFYKMPGQSYDKIGITSDFGCTALPFPSSADVPVMNGEYSIITDCYALPGDSGSPLIDEKNNIVGVAAAVEIERASREHILTYVTPITSGLIQAFNDFKDGKLQGRKKRPKMEL